MSNIRKTSNLQLYYLYVLVYTTSTNLISPIITLLVSLRHTIFYIILNKFSSVPIVAMVLLAIVKPVDHGPLICVPCGDFSKNS